MIIEKNIAIEKIVTEERLAVHSKLEGIEKLATSIEQHGLLQPVLVTLDRTGESTKSYLLLDGHRRLAAAKTLQHTAIRATVLAEKDEFLCDNPKTENDLCRGFAANLLRKKVSYEKLEAAVMTLHDQGWGYGKIAEKIGYSKAGIQKIINRAKRKDAPCSAESEKELRFLKRTNTALQELVKLRFDNAIFAAVQQVQAALKRRMEEIHQSHQAGLTNIEGGI